jgi:hypothetical protein
LFSSVADFAEKSDNANLQYISIRCEVLTAMNNKYTLNMEASYPPKRSCLYTRPHGNTWHNASVFIRVVTAIRASNMTQLSFGSWPISRFPNSIGYIVEGENECRPIGLCEFEII